MNYRYVTIFHAVGLYINEEESPRVVIDVPELRVFLAYDINDYATDIARFSAIIEAMFINNESDVPFTQTVAANIEERFKTWQKFSKGYFLVLEHKGYAEDFYTGKKAENEDFIVYLDGVDKSKVIEGKHEKFVAATTAIVLETGSVLRLEKVVEAIVFDDGSGKPAYSFKPNASGEGFLSKQLEADECGLIARRYAQLLDVESLERVVRLFTSSLETPTDKLRSFLSAWFALEIFINKVFRSDEKKMLEVLHKSSTKKSWEAYLHQNRNNMKNDNYRLSDKFAAIAYYLAPDKADADLETFKKSKKYRDAMSHGTDTDEKTLPVHHTQHLVKKYIRLYLDK